MSEWINKCHFGDVRDVLRQMIDAGVKVNCIVTSPPYWGLRSYLPADHPDKAREIGSEPTLREFIATMTEVFMLAREVLADDGTLFLNMGDSYSTGVANLPDFVHGRLKAGVVFFGCTDPIRGATERIHILLQDKGSPDQVFEPLFTAQRVSIKNGQDDFCQIGGTLDSPVTCWGSKTFGGRVPANTNTEFCLDVTENLSIVVAAGNLYADAALRRAVALSVEDRKATFAIEVAGEPVTEVIVNGLSAFDAFILDPRPVCATEIDPVHQPVSLLNRCKSAASSISNFSVRKASKEKCALRFMSGANLSFVGVGHLNLLQEGCITPWSLLLAQEQRLLNSQAGKQELGQPDLLKRALMEGGLICRQTIIWSKPNPMPESVRDRCTKAHEYLFLMTKSERYWWDFEAMQEPATGALPGNVTQQRLPDERDGQNANIRNGLTAYAERQRSKRDDSKRDDSKRAEVIPGQTVGTHRPDREESDWDTGMRNRRSVWTVPTAPYSGAHFATFPPALIEPCILAGCPAGGVVLDIFMGSGTTGAVAKRLGRNWIGIDIDERNAALQRDRISPQESFVLEAA